LINIKEKKMANVPEKIQTWQMVTPFRKDRETGEVTPGKIEKTEIDVPELKAGEVLVQVAGCGVCHTDLGYYYDGVPTVNKPPMTLGHEISGTVVDGDEKWIGKEVIIPAVMPCRKCLLCKTGKGNRCLAQKMPGNSMGIYGGFSSHIPVPSIDLCEVKDRGDIPLEHLSVVADAATSPYQGILRSGFKMGDNAIVMGIGGIGQYLVQELKAMGAKTVIALARRQEPLDKMLLNGADYVINIKDKSSRDVSKEIKGIQKSQGLANTDWKIFEATGSKPGAELALSLLSFTGTLVIVGYGGYKAEFAFSRLMAFDAEIKGTWGCLPEYYPIVLGMVTSKKINLTDYVQTRPMSTINEVFEEAHAQSPEKRIVLVPDF
jgi:6-hydroxycyclohex-1-ene-1-carbonyl-CoA dehydrogenase